VTEKYLLQPEYERLSEPEIVGRCQNGDLEAFNVLISRYETRVLNLAVRYLRDHHRAVDEAQEIFLKVFRKIGMFKGQSAFGTWLYRITANHCLNVIKQRRHQAVGSDTSVSLDTAREESFPGLLQDPKATRPDEAYAQEALRRGLAELIDQLPEIQRQAIILCHYEHLSYEEIAAVLEVPTSTIRSCLFRARRQLRIWLEKKGGRRA
jgi:RNA polymerase sigma-70 factor (ECF subfamily)